MVVLHLNLNGGVTDISVMDESFYLYLGLEKVEKKDRIFLTLIPAGALKEGNIFLRAFRRAFAVLATGSWAFPTGAFPI